MGREAFAQCGFESIDLSDLNLTDLPDGSFIACTKLRSVKLPETLETIVHDAFSSCLSLTAVHLPEGLTKIGRNAFLQCDSLTSINIPANVTSIDDEAFSFCQNLSDIYCYAKSTINWDTYNTAKSFKPNKGTVCHVLKGEHEGFEAKGLNLTFKEDLNCGDNAVWYYNTDTDTLTIGGTGKMYDYYHNDETPWYNFKDSIKKVVIEKGITAIGVDSFRRLSNLETVTFEEGSKLETIGTEAFCNLGQLKQLMLPEGLVKINGSAFANCDALEELTIPASVKTIENGAFEYCEGLKTLTFAENSQLTTIKDCAFTECESLTELSIPSSVETIGKYAFSNCSGLKTLTFAENGKLNTIDNYAFYDCVSITALTIPSTVFNIYDGAFCGCSGVETLTFCVDEKNN